MDSFLEILKHSQKIAIIGATDNQEKYGYKITKMLLGAGFTIYPINPNRKEVLGLKTYPTLSSLPSKVDIANFVVPPNVSLSILEDLPKGKIRYLWFQPGSENEKVLEKARELGYDPIYGFCIMEDGLKRLKSS